MSTIRVAINGASGKMGQQVFAAIKGESDFVVSGAIVSPSSKFQSNPVPHQELLQYTSSLSSALEEVHVVIDFSVPDALEPLLAACRAKTIGLVTGTTGFSETQNQLLQQTSQEIPIVHSPNMSTGVCVLWKLVEIATKALDNIDIEIVDIHHRDKLDSPSGTALRIADIVNSVRGSGGDANLTIGRDTRSGKRCSQEIGLHAIRGGDTVGEHTVMFLDKSERIEVSHRALSRSTFAYGALRAARFIATKLQQPQVGLFNMQDVLGIT